MEISCHVKEGALGARNFPRMLNRNWKKQAVRKDGNYPKASKQKKIETVQKQTVRKRWKLSKSKENLAVSKAESA